MKTFIFTQKCGDAVITLSATDFEDAQTILNELVKDTGEWRVEDEDGESK